MHEVDGGGAQQPPGLLGDGVEDRTRLGVLGDERREPAQGRLLVGQALEVLARLRVGDRGGHELSELRQAVLGAGRERDPRGPAGRHDAPDLAADDDRRPDPGMDTGRPGGLADAAGHVGVVVDPGRAPGAPHLRREAWAVERPVRAGREGVLADCADHGRRAVGLVARHLHKREVEELRDLGGDRSKDVARERALRDERRHVAQRRLLVGQPSQLLARLRVGQRGRDELGEAGEPLLDAIGQRTAVGSRHHHAPQGAVDDDRRPGRRADPGRPHGVCERPLDLRVVVDARGRAGLLHACGDGRAVERPSRADLERVLARAPCPDDRRRTVGLVAQHVDVRETKSQAHLLGDGGEDVRRACPRGHDSRHAAQGGLLLDEDGIALTAFVPGAQPVGHVGERHHRATAFRKVERSGHVRDHEHRRMVSWLGRPHSSSALS